jgi:hypothetical protein
MGFEPKHRNSTKAPPEAPDKAEKLKPKESEKKKEDKSKKEPEKKSKELKLPKEGFVNKYNFLRVSDAILTKLGWPTGVNLDVTLDIQNGALIIKRKSA